MKKSTISKKKQELTAEQKAELARFVEKINSMIPSEYQETIFERAKTQQGRYVINAGPGSGKTTTAIKASTYFRGGRSLYLAFNRKIMLDTHQKLTALGAKMTASTLHSFGLSCLQALTRGRCQVNDDKYDQIIDDYLRDHWTPFLMSQNLEDVPPEQHPSQTDAREWSAKLIHYAQVTLTNPTLDGLHALIEQFDLYDINPSALIWPFVCALITYALEEGRHQFQTYSTVSFDDMIYYPNALKDVPIRTYDHIILDEAQDASRAGLGLLMLACHEQSQVFAIGDVKQSIYQFAGADDESIPNIIKALNAEVLPLRVCYRCGKNIINLANQLDGQIIPAPGAHEGTVAVLSSEDYRTMLGPRDVVLARTTKHLVKDCLAVLQSGRRAMVLGKDLGRNIAAIVSRLEEMRVERGQSALARNLSNFAELLEEYTRIKQDEIAERRNLKNKDLALDELNDRIETIKAFYIAYISKCLDHSTIVEHDPKCQFNRTAEDFKYYIKALFTDDTDKNIILFMTAHRSKGGEWERVFIIGTDEFPHPKAKSDKQLVQENNLMYVAITRAINELYFVNEPFSCLTLPGYENEDQQEERDTQPVTQPAASLTPDWEERADDEEDRHGEVEPVAPVQGSAATAKEVTEELAPIEETIPTAAPLPVDATTKPILEDTAAPREAIVRAPGRPKKGPKGRTRMNISVDVDVAGFLRTQDDISNFLEQFVKALPEFAEYVALHTNDEAESQGEEESEETETEPSAQLAIKVVTISCPDCNQQLIGPKGLFLIDAPAWEELPEVMICSSCGTSVKRPARSPFGKKRGRKKATV